MKIRFLTIFLTALALATSLIQVVGGTYTLPSVSNTQGYVSNLIDSYNALVHLNYNTNSPSFQSTEGNFSLYHAVGNSFQVIVMQSSNTSGFVTLNFRAIGANVPNVTMDYNDTFDRAVTPGVISGLHGEYNVYRAITINYTNTITRIEFAFFINASDITGDYRTNSKNAAEFLYQTDLSHIPQPTVIIPNHSLLTDASSCVFAGICGIFGFIVGGVASIWYIYEKTHPKSPEREVGKRRRTQKSTRRAFTPSFFSDPITL